MSKILWVNSKTQTITKENRNKKMAKNILAPLFPTYPLCVCLHLCFTIQTPRFLDCTPYRVYSVQGYEMLCWCYRSKTFTSVLNLLQHNENLDRLKKRPSLTHTHTDLTVLESDGIWTVADFLYLQFSYCSHVSGLLFCFFFWLE